MTLAQKRKKLMFGELVFGDILENYYKRITITAEKRELSKLREIAERMAGKNKTAGVMITQLQDYCKLEIVANNEERRFDKKKEIDDINIARKFLIEYSKEYIKEAQRIEKEIREYLSK
jgi:hypothetical protein